MSCLGVLMPPPDRCTGAESWHRDTNGSLPVDYAQSESEEHEKCRLILSMARPKDTVKIRMPDTEDVDGGNFLLVRKHIYTNTRVVA
jgi:hypothetical protein